MGNSKSTRVPLSEEQLAGVFRNYDKDGDGKLTKEELKQAFNSMGSNSGAYRAYKGLRAADDNRDGVINKEEMDKLIHYAKRCNYTLC